MLFSRNSIFPQKHNDKLWGGAVLAVQHQRQVILSFNSRFAIFAFLRNRSEYVKLIEKGSPTNRALDLTIRIYLK